MQPFFVLVIEIFLLMNLRIVRPVSISGDSGDEKSFDSSKKKENDNEKLKIEDQNPKNMTLNFKGDEITVTFNKLIMINSKFIKLQPMHNIKDINDIFNISFINDKVKLKFKNSSFKKKGTYIITFLDGAVIDMHGNQMEQFSIIFSTNNTLDNYKLKGKVLDLMTSQEMRNVYVYLYKLNDNDLKNNVSSRNIINNNKPDYFVNTNIFGYYNFNNLTSGTYFLCAGEIDKENFMSDPNIHKYGFVPRFITIDDKNNEIEQDIYILKSLLNEFSIKNESTVNNKYIIETNDIIKEYNIDIKDNLIEHYSKYSDLLKRSTKIVDGKKLEFYNDNLGLISSDALPCHLILTSFNDEKIEKDIFLKFNNSLIDEDDEKDEENDDDNDNDEDGNDKDSKEFDVKTLSQDLSVDSLFDFNITTKKKVLSTDKSKFKIIIYDSYSIVKKIFTDFDIVEGSNTINIKTDKQLQDIIDDIVTTDKKFNILNKSDINVAVFVDKDAITYSDFSKNRNNIFNFTFLRNFSSIDISFQIPTDHFKLQLLDEKYDIIKEISDDLVTDRNNIVFNKIKNGKYYLRYLYWKDKSSLNKKNIWDSGNINKNIPNDPIGLYKKEILVNSGSTNEKIIID